MASLAVLLLGHHHEDVAVGQPRNVVMQDVILGVGKHSPTGPFRPSSAPGPGHQRREFATHPGQAFRPEQMASFKKIRGQGGGASALPGMDNASVHVDEVGFVRPYWGDQRITLESFGIINRYAGLVRSDRPMGRRELLVCLRRLFQAFLLQFADPIGLLLCTRGKFLRAGRVDVFFLLRGTAAEDLCTKSECGHSEQKLCRRRTEDAPARFFHAGPGRARLLPSHELAENLASHGSAGASPSRTQKQRSHFWYLR